jgi:hypothetical protein
MSQPKGISYRSLDPEAILSTVDALTARIHMGFPNTGLGAVATELQQVSREVRNLVMWLGKPLPWVRAVVGIGLILLLAGMVGALLKIPVSSQTPGVSDVLQGIDSGVNDVVFIGIAVFFLFTIETRVKRNRAFKSLHTLRSLAHIIDMHQLKKDPEQLSDAGVIATQEPVYTADQLARYLDHCGDMLALLSKLAALHVQQFNDGATLAVVQEVEDLAHDLLRNIWQKIVIVDRLHGTPLT